MPPGGRRSQLRNVRPALIAYRAFRKSRWMQPKCPAGEPAARDGGNPVIVATGGGGDPDHARTV